MRRTTSRSRVGWVLLLLAGAVAAIAALMPYRETSMGVDCGPPLYEVLRPPGEPNTVADSLRLAFCNDPGLHRVYVAGGSLVLGLIALIRSRIGRRREVALPRVDDILGIASRLLDRFASLTSRLIKVGGVCGIASGVIFAVATRNSLLDAGDDQRALLLAGSFALATVSLIANAGLRPGRWSAVGALVAAAGVLSLVTATITFTQDEYESIRFLLIGLPLALAGILIIAIGLIRGNRSPPAGWTLVLMFPVMVVGQSLAAGGALLALNGVFLLTDSLLRTDEKDA